MTICFIMSGSTGLDFNQLQGIRLDGGRHTKE
jgi:hypothetical protein